ncbi:MAG: hypothetical protein A3F90_04440 [Deltaproteobacteria bacterium RIFCSPLOWO2_12_FULL_60_19]|nr:MAG: hypothetical protein A3F90_04440 [Deltaproteobacteria bacterium RIFCSPLOWO2_12_FULL_60_19]
MIKKTSTKRFLQGLGRALYHVLLVAMSAGIAFSLPTMVSIVARDFWTYWALVEKQNIFLVSVEIALALLLVLFFNYLGSSWRDRRFARMARGSGMVHFFPASRFLTQRRIRRLKKKQGFARDIMTIASTGHRTFTDPRGDLHDVLQNCREAKLMLLNPHGEGAGARAKSILDPEVTPERFREQIKKSIDFLKQLKAVQKNIKLKLYGDAPFLKLAILGDYVWVKHYHPGLDIHAMPEYVFEHDQNPGSLYTPFYQYFLMRWDGPDTPEYDLETDELVYRDVAGNEFKREKFDAPSKHDGEPGAGESFRPASLTSLTYHHESSTRSGEADRGNAAVMDGGKSH